MLNASKLKVLLGRLEKALPVISLAVFGVALFFIHRFFKEISYRDVVGSFSYIPTARIIAAIITTVVCYLVLSCYDLLALYYLKEKISRRKVVFNAAISFALSQSIGLASLAGNSIRLRLYSAFGLKPDRTFKVIAFVGVSFWVGFLTLSGIAWVISPLPGNPYIQPALVQTVGLVFLALAGIYLGANTFRQQLGRRWPVAVSLPGFRITAMQMAVGCLDWALAATVLYIVLPDSLRPPFPEFVAIFLAAHLAGIISNIPGGLGVLEVVLIYFLEPEHQSKPDLLASLFAYRLIYYFTPLIAASTALLGYEISRRRKHLSSLAGTALRWTTPLVPALLGLLCFGAGVIMLLSGVTPGVGHRLTHLNEVVPLAAIEMSHFMASCVGTALLVLSLGLYARSNVAWFGAVVLASLGAVLSILKGFDYEEATLLSFLAITIYLSREQFYRRAALLTEVWSRNWIIAFLVVTVGTTWIGFFAHRHVEYDNDLWWNFSLGGHASRFLRALVGTSVTAIGLGLAHLLRPRGAPMRPESPPLSVIEPIVKSARKTVGNLALLGDKHIFLNEECDAFLMYAVQGGHWIVLGDPIGKETSFQELVFDFKVFADTYGGDILFYEIGPDRLPIYIDLGMIFVKIGEEARVPLSDFTLEGGARKTLRQSHTRLKQHGLFFEIVPASRFDEIKTELKRVSDAWLQIKQTQEKGFSLGYFDFDYLSRFSTAVLKIEGRIVAFANVWESSAMEEVSVDLMRFDPEGPHGTMDFLLVEVMFWGKAQGYRYFNLGMAPLSGIATSPRGSRWNRAANMMFEYGDRFYNFQGLRAYKEKFKPTWEPRYLAYSSKLNLPSALASLAVLISGGVKGVIKK